MDSEVAFLSELYLPLVRKSAKPELYPPGSVVGRVVAAGHAKAPFVLVPPNEAVEAARRRGFSGPGQLPQS